MKNLPNLDNFLVPPGSESIKQQPPKNESNGGRPQLQLRSYFYYLSNPDERPSLDLWRLYSALAEDLPVLNRELVVCLYNCLSVTTLIVFVREPLTVWTLASRAMPMKNVGFQTAS